MAADNDIKRGWLAVVSHLFVCACVRALGDRVFVSSLNAATLCWLGPKSITVAIEMMSDFGHGMRVRYVCMCIMNTFLFVWLIWNVCAFHENSTKGSNKLESIANKWQRCCMKCIEYAHMSNIHCGWMFQFQFKDLHTLWPEWLCPMM